MKCINCGKRIADNSKYCIHCGYDNSQNITVSTSRKKNRKIFLIPVILVLLCLSSLIYIYLFHRDYFNTMLINNRMIATDDIGNSVCFVKKKYNIKGKIVEQIKYDEYKNQLEKNTWKYDKKNRLVKTSMYEGDDNLIFYSINEYDENDKKGRIIKSSYYDGDDNLSHYSTYEYDRKGNNTKTLDYNSNGELQITTENIFDSDGNLIESSQDWINERFQVIRYYEGEKIKETIKTYYDENHSLKSKDFLNEKNQRVKEIRYDTDPSFFYTYTYEYDNDGRNIRQNKYDNNESLFGYEEYEYYGDDTRPTITRFYDGNGNIEQRYQYTYFDGTKIKELTVYGPDDQIRYHYTSEFDNQKRHIKSTKYDASNNIIFYYILEYRDGDESNYLSKVTFYNSDGDITSVDDYSGGYTFDTFRY